MTHVRQVKLMPLYPDSFRISDTENKAPARRMLFYFLLLLPGILLCIFWEPLRSTEFILSLQGYRSPVVDYFFRAFTFLGDDLFYLLFFCIMIWCADKPLAFSAAAVLLISGVCSNLIKEFTALPRPAIEGVIPPANYSFPSGHALTAVTLWGYLAVKIKKAWFWGWAITAIAVISFSRLILGFHFAGDVIGGLFLGLVLLAAFLWVESVLIGKKHKTSKTSKTSETNERGKSGKTSIFFALLLFSPFLVALGLIFILPGEGLSRILGIPGGGFVGYILEKEKNLFRHQRRSLQHHLMNILIGLSGVVVIVFGLGAIFVSAVPVLSFLYYALTGFWITFLAPLLFTRLS